MGSPLIPPEDPREELQRSPLTSPSTRSPNRYNYGIPNQEILLAAQAAQNQVAWLSLPPMEISLSAHPPTIPKGITQGSHYGGPRETPLE